MNKPYFCRNFFLIDWCHKHLKNKIDILLFYAEHFYEFPESDLWKRQKKNIHFVTNISIYTVTDTWSFVKFYFAHIVKVCFAFKKTVIVLIFLCIWIKHSQHKEIRKNNSKINFVKICRASLIFSRASKNLKMFYFNCPTGRVLKK